MYFISSTKMSSPGRIGFSQLAGRPGWDQTVPVLSYDWSAVQRVWPLPGWRLPGLRGAGWPLLRPRPSRTEAQVIRAGHATTGPCFQAKWHNVYMRLALTFSYFFLSLKLHYIRCRTTLSRCREAKKLSLAQLCINFLAMAFHTRIHHGSPHSKE